MKTANKYVSATEIKKAIAPVARKLMRMGFGKPEFRTTNCLEILPVDADCGRGIVWGGDNRDFDSLGVKSIVIRGESVSLNFHDSEGYIAGDLTWNSETGAIVVENNCGAPMKI